MEILSDIKSRAHELGFDACGVARRRTMQAEYTALEAWTGSGRHAGMDYLTRYADLRIDPARLFGGTESVIVCLISYKTARPYSPGIPRIASYARSADYHYTVKQKLEQLLAFIREAVPGTEGRCFVDSAPVLEKNWAVEAGLGWMGRNSLLIHPELGSFCFIGIILTTLRPDGYDPPFAKNLCGNCRKCVDACPVGAIGEDGFIDARRCLSYQTIENRGPVPDELLPGLGDRLFGCDTCQEVCPWNVKPVDREHRIFAPVEGIYEMGAGDWLALGSGAFKRRFGQTPLARAGLKKLKQTLLQKERERVGEEGAACPGNGESG